MSEKTSTYEPMVLVDTADLPEDEWLEWRRRGIGGSDAAAILCYNIDKDISDRMAVVVP